MNVDTNLMTHIIVCIKYKCTFSYSYSWYTRMSIITNKNVCIHNYKNS